MEAALDLPPLLTAHATTDAPLGVAVARAAAGADPGTLVHRAGEDRAEAALILAPEVPLADAMVAVICAGCGFVDAFGALAPSEIAAEVDWPGTLRINGAVAGGIAAAASTRDPAAEPDWLVVALDVAMRLPKGAEPGADPDRTALAEEGCADLTARRMIEAWARHTTYWLHDWAADGPAAAHRHWTARAWGLGRAGAAGTPLGLDEQGGLLIKSADGTRTLPLTGMLEDG